MKAVGEPVLKPDCTNRPLAKVRRVEHHEGTEGTGVNSDAHDVESGSGVRGPASS